MDGEVAGTTGDFGLALVGSKAGFGVGNPDTTLASVKAINDGLWHQVAITRDAGSGAMTIWIDGKFDSTLIGPFGVRTNSPALRIGSIQTGNGFLNGSISDVALYQQALSTNRDRDTLQRGDWYILQRDADQQGQWRQFWPCWPGNGKLLEATSLSGPWTTNVSASPVTVVPSQLQEILPHPHAIGTTSQEQP